MMKLSPNRFIVCLRNDWDGVVEDSLVVLLKVICSLLLITTLHYRVRIHRGMLGIFLTFVTCMLLILFFSCPNVHTEITLDISKRNKSIHRWLRSDSNDQHDRQLSSSKTSDDIIPDHRSLLITQNYAWRDQLVASPIAFDEKLPPSSSSKPNYHLTTMPKKPSFKTSFVDKCLPTPKKKSTSERLKSSHLGQRLPPLNNLPFIKWVQRPNQLVQMLQLATHKLNELHGTNRTHNKMLRLFNLSEFSVHPNDVISNAPTVPELAEYMDITPITLKKWFTLYKNAIMRDFDFNQFGNERIKDHHSIFYAEDERYQLSNLGELTIEEYFQQVGEEVFEDAVDACKDSRRRRDGMNRRESSLEFNTLTDCYNIFDDESVEMSSGPPILRESRRSSKTARCESMEIIAEDDEDQLLDNLCPFDRHLQINQAYLAELRSRDDDDAKNIQLGSSCKRIKAGSKDRVLCMVSGCEKHAQAKSNGCCSSHFRILSKGKSKTVSSLHQATVCMFFFSLHNIPYILNCPPLIFVTFRIRYFLQGKAYPNLLWNQGQTIAQLR